MEYDDEHLPALKQHFDYLLNLGEVQVMRVIHGNTSRWYTGPNQSQGHS